MNNAYVCLLLNAAYLPGVITLAKSLASCNSKYPLVLLYAKTALSDDDDDVYLCLQQSGLFDRLINIDDYLFQSRNGFELTHLLKRGELFETLTKLNAWRLVDYDKVIYLDADMLILQNIDSLFDSYNIGSNEIVAASDSGWPDIFNSGLFLIKPDLRIFEKLKEAFSTMDSFDGADQGLLNEFFNLKSIQFGTKWHRLPFTYNCTLNSNYEYLPAMIRFKHDVKVVHFIGVQKPWKNESLCWSNEYLKIFNNGSDNLFGLWWQTFKSVHEPVKILEISGHIQPKISIEKVTEGFQPVTIDAESVTTVSNEHNSKFQFPMYYYKETSADPITDISEKGEGWKLDEKKVRWPKDEDQDQDHQGEALATDKSEEPVGEIIDSYVKEHPIFPWESKPYMSTRTFTNKLEPPTYSISVTSSGEMDINVTSHTLLSSDKKEKLVGFDNGDEFEKYLKSVEDSKHAETAFTQSKEPVSNLNIFETPTKRGAKFDFFSPLNSMGSPLPKSNSSAAMDSVANKFERALEITDSVVSEVYDNPAEANIEADIGMDDKIKLRFA
ncbi:glycogenin glucosyltransferase [Martiniozyma asiatica (nom. inval.)]|nr:glycogenin glucosyltransferase [Martiniozyma asiatica]